MTTRDASPGTGAGHPQATALRDAARRPRWQRVCARLAVAAITAPLLAITAFAIASWLSPFPIERLQRWPASPRVTDRTGREILAITGRDEQWRFPVPLEQVSPWLIQATIAAEDRQFGSHCGIDSLALARAAWQDASCARIVSGGSTLTMQVCRMMDNRPRTWRAKCVEIFRSLQLERIRDKDWILQTYLNIAPYGRNLRGAQAAAWTWFGKPASDLSLAEAALLAGLPQSPSRYRPDRFPERARARRDTVLRRMVELGMIDANQRRLAAAEPIAIPYRKKPIQATHAGWLALKHRPGGGRTTIDPQRQADVERLVAEHVCKVPARSDIAAVVIDIPTGDILALVGSANPDEPSSGQVDGATARRSPGSALKPFVYAGAFEDRRLTPQTTVFDIPIEREGWSPSNFDRTFKGPIAAGEALRRSLNVPAILVTEQIGLQRCAALIEAAGIDLGSGRLSRSGLSTVVGGAEVRLLDLTNAYATIGRDGTWQQPRLFIDDPALKRGALEANVCAALGEVLSSRQRRPAGMELLAPHDVPWFMWKTGTSSGRRDAWAVGHNGKVAIGVWVGRFSGLGDAQLTGAQAAEPLLARLFDLPALRQTADPPRANGWTVAQPLPPPPEQNRALRIVWPRSGSTFIATPDRATVRPRLNRPVDVTWFLNGKCMDADAATRLSLVPGRYELRCVDAGGETSAATFSVR